MLFDFDFRTSFQSAHSSLLEQTMATRWLVPTRRFLSSANVGTIKPLKKSLKGPPKVSAPLGGESFDLVAEITPETHMRNAALAASLLGFCFGVGYYSMTSVGQAGSEKDDPLAVLKEEAAQAQKKADRESRTSEEASDMLRQFQAGGFDPDKDEELELEEEIKAKKRPWYKFW